MSYTTITIEGGLIPAELLEQIAAGAAEGQRAEDFGLDKNQRLLDAIAAAWGEAREAWIDSRRRTGESAVTTARERWMRPLLRALGYTELSYMPTAARIDNRTYAISHRAGADESGPPVHIEGFGIDLDRRPPSGRPRLSPHALMQEYLNSHEHLWGIVANGDRLRLLRDSSQITRPRFVEFDLRGMLEGEQFGEFAVMYRLLHRSRLPRSDADTHECRLEKYHQQGVESGGRVREGLRRGVEVALKELGNGLLEHPRNEALRDKLAGGELQPLDYYRTLLRLVYRLLFLMVAEERGLVAADEDQGDILSPLRYRAPRDERLRIYLQHYSVGRLRRLADAPGAGRAPYGDLWLGLWTTFRLFEGDESARLLGIAPLGGDLFGQPALDTLEGMQLRNDRLLAAVRALSTYEDPESHARRRVNYAALDVEELGSVYESLLDYRPAVSIGEDQPQRREENEPQRHKGHKEDSFISDLRALRAFVVSFDLVQGTERKTTGSYYTRPELVAELIKSALEPVIEDRLKGLSTAEAREAALLGIKVCDPACGSGHFLLAAARRIGRELARVRSGEDQPTPPEFRRAVRDAINRCVYGVDLNPLAVDLCKLALWIEGHNAGTPLSFLDAHIRRGNSLVGATRELVEAGIPDDAYKPVTGDDKRVAAELRKRNKRERVEYLAGARQGSIFDRIEDGVEALADAIERVEVLPENSVVEVDRRAKAYGHARDRALAEFARWNLWTAAFFQPLSGANERFVPTSADLLGDRGLSYPKVAMALPLAEEVGFFHWELEFPQVFHHRGTEDTENGHERENHKGTKDAKNGFDVLLGNPPWEMLQLDPQEFFAGIAPAIARALNMAARERMIKQLPEQNPELFRDYAHAKQLTDAQQRFVHECGRFPLTSFGRINLMALFAELARMIRVQTGRAGLILPTGIATDSFNQHFFADLVSTRQLVSLYDFENRTAIFPGVHRSYKFCLLTIGATRMPARFSFFATDVRHLEDDRRVFELSAEDIALLNPNTRTVPIFRTRADAELTEKLYRRVPVLVNEKTGENSWGISFMLMFMMNTDSYRFRTAPGDGLLPLYEAKLLHQFTHRWATYGGPAVHEYDTNTRMDDGDSIGVLIDNSRPDARDLTPADLADPHVAVAPRYWVSREEVEARLAGRWERGWLLGFRDIARSTDERTAIFSLLPRVAVNHKAPLLFVRHDNLAFGTTLFLASINSLVLDFVARQKVGGTSLGFFILKQLPVLPPSTFSDDNIAYIVPRVLELVYTAWDMQPFAEDVWAELDEEGRRFVFERWKENHKDTKDTKDGHSDSLCPSCLCGEYSLEPFIWHEARRAHIRAELDARIARLYGLTRDELRYILDPRDVYGDDFPGETFRVLKEKEMRQYGEYRTHRLVLEAWDQEEGMNVRTTSP